jgi:hypothetical protein
MVEVEREQPVGNRATTRAELLHDRMIRGGLMLANLTLLSLLCLAMI